MSDIMQGPPPPPVPPPDPVPQSLLQRVEALESQLQRIYSMMARDREWMDDLRERIGL